MAYRSQITGLFLLTRAYDQVIGPGKQIYDCRHWQAERPMGYTMENIYRTQVSERIYEIEARADYPNATYANARLVPSVDPVDGLWFRLRWLSLRKFLEYAASQPGERASPYGHLWDLACDLSDRTTAVRGRLVAGLVLLGCRLPLIHPLTWHECLLASTAASHHELDDGDQTTASRVGAFLCPLSEFLPRGPPYHPRLGCSGQVLLLLCGSHHLWTRGDHPRTRAGPYSARGLERRLAVAHARLQEYSAQAEEMAAIRERNRIAREIHDTLGHSLTLLAVQLETAAQYEARGDSHLHQELQEARRVAKACLTDVRHSVEALRPDDAAAGSLPERLRRLAADFSATCRETAITLDLDEATHSLSPDLSLTLYRCAQEALTNIRKHARATKVLLYMSTSDGPGGHGGADRAGQRPGSPAWGRSAGAGLRLARHARAGRAPAWIGTGRS